MNTETPQLAVSRVFDAPRALVFGAFTDPDHLAMWWGPRGNSLPRGEIEFDVRPGGFQRWTEVAAAEPDLRVHVYIDTHADIDRFTLLRGDHGELLIAALTAVKRPANVAFAAHRECVRPEARSVHGASEPARLAGGRIGL